MKITLFNKFDEPVDCNFDELQLIYEDNSDPDYIIKYYAFKKDIKVVRDHFRKTIRIKGNNVDVDCEIAELIDKLNNKSNKKCNSTRFCCSSHYYMGETWLYAKPRSKNIFERNPPIVIYGLSPYYSHHNFNCTIVNGYIAFNSINKELEKIVPLCKNEPSIDRIVDDISKFKKPIVYTIRHNFGLFRKCTILYW